MNDIVNIFFNTGDTVGDYIIDSFIGKGAYGEVYKVHDTLGKPFALKLLYGEQENETTFREIQGLTALRGSIRGEEGLPLIYYVGEFENRVYYTMDLADNASSLPGVYKPDTLERRLQEQGRLSGLDCIHLMRGLLISLKALHQHGLVHRDIKPGNIIFFNKRPMLADIGLVTSSPRTLVGTAGFHSPYPSGGPTMESEQAGDLYSLGKVLYCAFTGEPVDRYPLLPQKYSLEDFKAIRPLYLSACSGDDKKRYRNCDEFLKAVDQSELKLNSGPAVFQRKFIWGLIAAVLILAAAAAAYWGWRTRSVLPVPSTMAGIQEQAAVKISLNNGVYHIFCCFSCNHLDSKDPHARSNQFMAASFLKSALSQELGVPKGKYLKIRYGKYSVQPFKQKDLLVYIYEIAVDDCLILPVEP